MIIDIQKFIEQRKASWKELEELIDKYEESQGRGWSWHCINEFNTLYTKVCSDLTKAQTFSSDREIIEYLESLVARAYGQIYRRRNRIGLQTMASWAYAGFPRAFRNQFRYFIASLAVTIAGAALGGFLVVNDTNAKEVVFGDFGHLLGDPSERVKNEETRAIDQVAATHAQFSGELMTHNIRVSLFALSLGLIWGFGTLVILFYNGAILGGVCVDYILAGESVFLAGWLLPHGVIEIPAILIAGQTGFVLAKAMIGWDSDLSLSERLRAVRSDVSCLIGGIMLMLVWAGFVESYLSQTHEPAIEYSTKISIGLIELAFLLGFLCLGGRFSMKRIGSKLKSGGDA